MPCILTEKYSVYLFGFFYEASEDLVRHDALLTMKQLKMKKKKKKITYNEIIESYILLCAMTWETVNKRKQTDRLENSACILFIFSYK